MRRTPRACGAPLLTSVTVLLGSALTACGPSEPVILGVATSGTFADAARLAVEDAQEDGPLPALDTIVISEGSNNVAPAIRAAEVLVGEERLVAVVGHSNSAASLAAAPLYGEHEVVQIAPTSTAETYSRAGPYSFRLVPADDRQGAFLADQVTEQLPRGGRVALFYVNDDYGRGLRRAFLDNLDEGRFEVAIDLPHTESEVLATDITRAGERLAELQPDIVLWLARGTVLDRHLPAIRSALPDVPILGGDGLSSIRQDPGAEDLRRGIRYVGFVDLGSTAALRSFSGRYEERLGRPATGPDVLTYDAVRLLVDAVRAGARSGPAIRAYLHSLGRERPAWTGLSGPVTFDENGDVEGSYVLLTHTPEPPP